MATIDRVRRVRRSREWWGHFVEGWPRSGLTQAQYCRRHGVPLGSFSWWRFRLRPQPRKAPKIAPTFLPVTITRPAALVPRSTSSGIEVVLAGGRVVRVHERFDANLLRRVVAALEERSC
jgi:transposase